METQLANITQQEITPIQMIMAAVSSQSDLDKVRGLLELQERWEANQARKSFHQAMAEFKAVPLMITKDKENKQYKSMYTTLGNLVNTANPELSKHGLSSSWEISQNGVISVSCKITHKLGHSEQCTASAPADTSGSKNPIQQIKSTITYLKSVTFESITGLASTDANLDDDGKGVVDSISEAQLKILDDLISTKQIDKSLLLTYLEIESLDALLSKDYMKATQAINVAKKVGSK